MSSLPINQQRSHHHFTHCALHFRHRCCKRRNAVRWDTQQTYKLWRSRRQHTQHITTRSGLKRGVTRNVRENWHAIATRSHSLATSRWCDDDNDEHTTAVEYINNVYNALHKITNISQRKYKSKDIEEYINRIGMTLCIDKRNKHNEEKVVIEKMTKFIKDNRRSFSGWLATM